MYARMYVCMHNNMQYKLRGWKARGVSSERCTQNSREFSTTQNRFPKTHGSQKGPFYRAIMGSRALFQPTFVTTAFLADTTGFFGKYIFVTASTRAFRRAAATPTTCTTAHTAPDRGPGLSTDQPAAPQASMHITLLPHKHEPAHHNTSKTTAQPLYTPTTRTHTHPSHTNHTDSYQTTAVDPQPPTHAQPATNATRHRYTPTHTRDPRTIPATHQPPQTHAATRQHRPHHTTGPIPHMARPTLGQRLDHPQPCSPPHSPPRSPPR